MKYLGLIPLLLLAGCGAHEVTSLELDAHIISENARGKCYEARRLDLRGVPKEAVGYAVMGKNFSDAMLAMAGKDPCRGDNLFSYLSREVESKNKALSSTTSNMVDLGKWAVGAYAVDSILDTAGGTYTSSGQSSTYVTNESASRNTATSTAESHNSATMESVSNTPSTADSYNTTPSMYDSYNKAP